MKNPIFTLRQKLKQLDTYQLEITESLLRQCTSDEVLDKLFAASCLIQNDGTHITCGDLNEDYVKDEGKIVLYLRKLYSLEVGLEETLGEIKPAQKESAATLKRVAMAIAELENESVKKIEEKIGNLVMSGFRASDLPITWLPYVNSIVGAVNAMGNDKEKMGLTVTEVLRKRVVIPPACEPVLEDWTIEDTRALGKNFIEYVYTEFVVKEQNAWKDYEGEVEPPNSGNESTPSSRESPKLTGTDSGSISKDGESTTLDTAFVVSGDNQHALSSTTGAN